MTTLLILLFAQQPDFEPLFRQALAQRSQSLGPQAPLTRQSARDLALYLAARGDHAQAADYVEPALATANTTQAATALHNWAVAIEESDAALAERLYRKALQLRAGLLPAQDPELASTRLNLAGLLLPTKPTEAGPLALAALRAFAGTSDARAGAACGILGAVYATQGNVPGAEQMFRRALTLADKAHGPNSPFTASALENLADLLRQTGRESTARPLLERAQNIRARAR